MQPWLDFDPRETGCRRCGRALRGEDVHIWACRERTRRLDFGGEGGGGRIRYDEISRAYPVCGECWRALERGGAMAGASLLRLLLLFGAALALVLASAPLVHRWAPNFASAFYRDGSMGR
jgi:hypothetical protein